MDALLLAVHRCECLRMRIRSMGALGRLPCLCSHFLSSSRGTRRGFIIRPCAHATSQFVLRRLEPPGYLVACFNFLNSHSVSLSVSAVFARPHGCSALLYSCLVLAVNPRARERRIHASASMNALCLFSAAYFVSIIRTLSQSERQRTSLGGIY